MKQYETIILQWLVLCVVTTPCLSLLSVQPQRIRPVIVESSSSSTVSSTKATTTTSLYSTPTFYNDFEGYNDDDNNNSNSNGDDDDDDDDDDDIDDLFLSSETTKDWRAFRRALASKLNMEDAGRDANDASSSSSSSATESKKTAPSVSTENQELLQSQNPELFYEFRDGAWAHTTPTPEVGGLMVRMPLEVELQRNFRHSVNGASLLEYEDDEDEIDEDTSEMERLYRRAKAMIEEKMLSLADKASDDGQLDASTLDEEMAELLQLYLDNQETWQEVCLVLENGDDGATTVVLNRPMAYKLTDSLGQLVLNGAYSTSSSATGSGKLRITKHPFVDMNKFTRAFGEECAIYVGGPDDQDQPAEVIHGIANLAGATELAPGTGIYRGGLPAAVDGVLEGKYKPLDFRFFIGRHHFEESSLDLMVVLGKLQPVACARAVALKQCISLPQPLWHEVLELCGGEMHDISQLELEKRNDDITFQIVDDEEIIDELGELDRFDDDDDDEDYYSK